MVHIYNGTSLSHEKSEIMPLTATRMHLYTEPHRERQILYAITHMWSLKKHTHTNELIYKKEVDSQI